MGEIREAGRTAFLSSHELDEVERVCDRVGIIREGRLIAVENVDEMRRRAYRAVTVRIAGEPPAAELARVAGVEQCTAEGSDVRFRVRGSLDPVIKALAAHRVDDLEVTRPSLEELFLRFYGSDGAR